MNALENIIVPCILTSGDLIKFNYEQNKFGKFKLGLVTATMIEYCVSKVVSSERRGTYRPGCG